MSQIKAFYRNLGVWTQQFEQQKKAAPKGQKAAPKGQKVAPKLGLADYMRELAVRKVKQAAAFKAKEAAAKGQKNESRVETSPSQPLPPDSGGTHYKYHLSKPLSSKAPPDQVKLIPGGLGPTSPSQVDPNKVVYSPATSRFFFHGKEMTLTQVMFEIGSKAATVAKENLANALERLSDSNKQADAAVAWMNDLRNLTPDSSGNVTAKTLNDEATTFNKKYGFSPFTKYDITKKTTGTYTVSDVTSSTKSYADTINSNQQAIQLSVSRYTHSVQDAQQLIAAVNKAMSDTDQSIISKTV